VLPESSPAVLRLATILADRRFAQPMPVWAFVVEHPDGLIVIDAGADAAYADARSWNGHQVSRRLLQSFIRLDVQPGESLPEQMLAANLDPEDVSHVVLTHQHVDHTASVPSFRRAVVWTTLAEDRAASRMGAEQWRWRDETTNIRHIDAVGEPAELGTTVDILGDGTLLAIHTPGHTPGSVTARLVTRSGDLWFTGDTSFTAGSMDPAAPTAGIHSDMVAVRRLQGRLRGRGVLLPAHDEGVPDRLRSAGQLAAKGAAQRLR
jgi:glyoxylase-like metal-dependent hydrolase (beta-lactamase superfamily II)